MTKTNNFEFKPNRMQVQFPLEQMKNNANSATKGINRTQARFCFMAKNPKTLRLKRKKITHEKGTG